MNDFAELVIPDDDHRPRHPYVAEHPHSDASAREYQTTGGDTVTVEQQGWQSRSAFHVIEGMLGALTPAGMLNLTVALLHRLNPTALASEVDEITVDDLDPFGTFREFERLAGHDLSTALEACERAAAICPGCGRRHGEVGWVHTATGDSVQVVGMTTDRVYYRTERAPGEWGDVEEMARLRFEQLYVPGSEIPLLGGHE